MWQFFIASTHCKHYLHLNIVSHVEAYLKDMEPAEENLGIRELGWNGCMFLHIFIYHKGPGYQWTKINMKSIFIDVLLEHDIKQEHRPLTWTSPLSRLITPENFMIIRWLNILEKVWQTTDFVQNFVAISEFKPEVWSENRQVGRVCSDFQFVKS